MLQTYGFDLAAEWGTIGVRRLWVLVMGLPSAAPLWRAEKWDYEDEIAATTLEQLHMWGRRIVEALGGKITGKPLSVPRPQHFLAEQEPEMKRTNRITSLKDMREIAAWFGKNK